MKSNRVRASLALALVSVAVFAWSSGAFDSLDAEAVQGWIQDAGPWGPVLYVGLFIALEPFGVPGLVFVIPGGLVWDWPTLFMLTWLGATGAGIVGFLFARTLGRDFVERRLSARARAYDQALAENGLRTVIMIRLLFFIAPWAHWLLGLSKVRFRDFVLGTIIGLVPMMALFTWLGGNAVEWFRDRPFLAGLGLLLVITGLVVAARRFHASVEERSTA